MSDLGAMRSLVAALERLSERFEPGVHDLAGSKELVDLAARGKQLLSSIEGRAARRVEQTVNWKTAEQRNAAAWLSEATGETIGAATRMLETARRLESLPEPSDAFRAGGLSEAQAAEVVQAASLDPSAEHRLLETVRGSKSFKTVRDVCRETAVRAGEDRAKARWLHEQRRASWWTDGCGHWRVDAKLAPDDAAWIRSALELETDEIFRAARARGETEPRAAYRADALVAVVAGRASKKPLDARLHAERDAIDRGYVLPGERCELEGIGPIPVTTARAMLDDARVTMVGHDSAGDITHISSPKRNIPARLRRWVEEAYPCCGVHGCTDDWHLEIDHVVAVGDGGPTEKQNLWRLCRHHHQLKTYRGWRVVGRELVPPDVLEPPGDPP
ncbi:MAG TPA: HNH endonuclease signature motif containing protein [Acidimicrobiia bacterium]